MVSRVIFARENEWVCLWRNSCLVIQGLENQILESEFFFFSFFFPSRCPPDAVMLCGPHLLVGLLASAIRSPDECVSFPVAPSFHRRPFN